MQEIDERDYEAIMSMSNSEQKEYLLRGKMMALSAEIETLVVMIILVSNVDNKRDELVKLKGLMMSDKVKKSRCLLKEFHPEIFSFANPILKRFQRISKFRNLMAHCIIYWLDPTLMSFEVVDIVEDETDGDYMDMIKYTIREAFDEILKFQKLVKDLSVVNDALMKKSGFPMLFDLLQKLRTPNPAE